MKRNLSLFVLLALVLALSACNASATGSATVNGQGYTYQGSIQPVGVAPTQAPPAATNAPRPASPTTAPAQPTTAPAVAPTQAPAAPTTQPTAASPASAVRSAKIAGCISKAEFDAKLEEALKTYPSDSGARRQMVVEFFDDKRVTDPSVGIVYRGSPNSPFQVLNAGPDGHAVYYGTLNRQTPKVLDQTAGNLDKNWLPIDRFYERDLDGTHPVWGSGLVDVYTALEVYWTGAAVGICKQ